MSVTVTQKLNIRLFIPQPPLDNPYPVGRFVGARKVTGDASGGVVACIMASPSASESAKYAWGLEGYSCRYSSNNGALGGMSILAVPAEPFVDDAGNLNIMQMHETVQIPVSTSNYGMTRTGGRSGALDFIHQPGGGLTNSYTMQIDLNAAIDFYFFIWGYLWHPQVFRLAGGPRRP